MCSHCFKFISIYYVQFSSVQFSRSVMSNSLRPHESQHARPPCPSPSPRVHSDSRLSSPWCHPAISSSVVPFSSCPQSFRASESFPMSQLLHEVAKILEWVTVSISRGSSQSRDRNQVSCTTGRFFTIWATRKAYNAIKVQHSVCQQIWKTQQWPQD